MNEGKYEISGKEYLMHTDQSWDEIAEIENLFERLQTGSNQKEIKGGYTRDEIKRALSLILKPADGSKSNIEDYGKASPQQSVQIIADFFLSLAVLTIITENILPALTNAQKMLLMNTTG